MKRATSNAPLIPCAYCRGRGRLPMPRQLAKAWSVLRRLGRASAPELHRAMGLEVGETAVNNWLEKLRKRRLVSRRRGDGNVWFYQALALEAGVDGDEGLLDFVGRAVSEIGSIEGGEVEVVYYDAGGKERRVRASGKDEASAFRAALRKAMSL